MNIAIATTEFVSEKNFDGGLANYTYKLAKLLLAKKHSVTVYLTSNVNESFQYDGIDLVKINIPNMEWKLNYQLKRVRLDFLISLKMRYKLQALQESYYLNKELKKANKLKKIDIIHYPNVGSLAFFRLKKIPTIVRLSGSTIRSHQLGGYGQNNLEAQVIGQLEYKAMIKADAVFGPSVMIAKETEHIIKKKITIIETPFLQPINQLDYTIYDNILSDKKYILFFGSIGLIKGIGTIANMIYQLLNAHKAMYFVFVGKILNNDIEGKNVWDYLLEKAAEHKNRIIHFNPLKHELLFPIIKHAELVALPSRIDNFPNACIEAMSLGKIVIGTQENGFEQLIEHQNSGYLIPVDDDVALLQAINSVLALSIDAKNKIAQSAMDRINELSPEHIVPQLERFYESVIQKHN